MKRLFQLTIFLLPVFVVTAQNTPDFKIEKAAVLDRAIPQLMATADIPGLSIAIVEGDQIVYQHAFGLRSVDTREPVTDQTIFSAASLSKALFAFGLMKWVEAGRFDLDKPLQEYFPYTDLEHDKRYKKLTARQVLSHTTGLPNWRRGSQLDFLRDPGEQFGYSGEGFVYLMRVVEHLSGQTINDFMKNMVFEPLNMSRSSYVWEPEFDGDCAIPHDKFARTQRLRKPKEGNTAYSLQTTAVDYSKFLSAMLTAKGLQKNTIDNMLKSQIDVEEQAVQWGLGVGLQTTKEGKAFWHWGDNGPFKAFFITFPGQNMGLVYFANSANGLGIAQELLSTCLGGSYPAVSWIDYEGPKAPARQLLTHILQDKVVGDWPFLDKNGRHQDTNLIKESPMNRLGYDLLSLGRLEEACRVFEMNTLAFPQSANVYDSYGEALLRNGQLEAAAEAYEKAVKLNPENKPAATLVHQIRKGNQQGNTAFRLGAYPYAKSVQLAGDFNNWSEITHPMVRENGQWIGRVDLDPGTYQYKFIVDGVWILDLANPETKYKEQHNSVLVKE